MQSPILHPGDRVTWWHVSHWRDELVHCSDGILIRPTLALWGRQNLWIRHLPQLTLSLSLPNHSTQLTLALNLTLPPQESEEFLEWTTTNFVGPPKMLNPETRWCKLELISYTGRYVSPNANPSGFFWDWCFVRDLRGRLQATGNIPYEMRISPSSPCIINILWDQSLRHPQELHTQITNLGLV